MKSPIISSALKKEHKGEVVISLDGTVIAFGKNSVDALKKAKSVMPDIEHKEFLVSRIQHDYIIV